jgi:hypothetical protein
MKEIMGYLAFVVHERFSEGIIDRDEAVSIVEDYLRDPEGNFNLSVRDARQQSQRVLNIVENSLGLLVWRSQDEIGFYHRVFQEYLAGYYMSGLDLAEQMRLVETRSTDVQWREVILALFHCTRRPEEIRQFIKAVQGTE